jgi:hypothetical protein
MDRNLVNPGPRRPVSCMVVVAAFLGMLAFILIFFVVTALIGTFR